MVLANMENTIINKIGKFLGVEGNFASWFVLIGILTQCLTCYIMGDTLLALCSGIAGVISVVLCSQKKYSFYFWGLLQLITIIIISYNSGLYGKVIENGFYLLTMFVGMSEWKKNKDNGDVKVRSMDIYDCILFGTLFIPLCTILSYSIVASYNSGQIVLDTTTTVIGIVAQVLMILRFKEQWILWFILDILCIVLWAIDGNWCLVTQYIFWTINCVYGYKIWKS
jgi:nicotinamide mononucleotide transporter